jgi:hypothetical protein
MENKNTNELNKIEIYAEIQTKKSDYNHKLNNENKEEVNKESIRTKK